MANDPLAVKSYYAIKVSTAAAASLMTLITAAYAALSGAPTVPNLSGAQVRLHAIVGNTKLVLVGDAQVSTTNFAYGLPVSTATFLSQVVYGPFNKSEVPLSNIFIMSDDGTTSVSLGVEIITG